MSDFVEGFLRGCKEDNLTEEQTKQAALHALLRHPELEDEFKKSAIWPMLIGAALGTAVPWLIDKARGSGESGPSQPAAPTSQHTRIEEPPAAPEPPKIGAGAPPSNLYAQPGMGGMAPRFWPSMAMPPGGFPGYGHTGMPGAPFGTSPFQHTVVPPMPKMGGAKAEKKAFLGALLSAGTKILPRLANSFAGRNLAGGLVQGGNALGGSAGNALASAGKTVGRTGAARARVVQGLEGAQNKKIQSLMQTGGYANPEEAAAHLAQNKGVLRNTLNSTNVHGSVNNAMAMGDRIGPKPGFWSNHGMTLGTTGLLMSPMLMGGMGDGGYAPPPQPQGGMEQRASWFPPTIGPEKQADTSFGGTPVEDLPKPVIPTKPGGHPGIKLGPKAPAPTTYRAGLLHRIGGGLTRGGVQMLGGAALGLGGSAILKNLAAPYKKPEAAGVQAPTSPFDKTSAFLPGGADDMRDVPPPHEWKPLPVKRKQPWKAKHYAGAAAIGAAGALTAHGLNRVFRGDKEKRASNPFV